MSGSLTTGKSFYPLQYAGFVSLIERIIVIGSGSAGRRHALTFREIFPDSHIDIVKRSRSVQPLESLKDRRINTLKEIPQIDNNNYDVAVIASPSTFHLADVKTLMTISRTILIEKPLTSDLNSALELQQILNNSGKKSAVAYHLKFSETVIVLKEKLQMSGLGRLISANLNYSQDLLLWRPNVDPRQSVSAREDLGGGVLLEFSHEIEAIHHLIGPIEWVSSKEMSFHGAPTDGKVDTITSFIGETKNGVAISIHLDMLTRPPTREWNFVFENGEVNANLISGEIFMSNRIAKFKKLHQSGPNERDRAGALMLNRFANTSVTTKINLCDIDEGVKVMGVIDAVSRSAQSKRKEIVSVEISN